MATVKKWLTSALIILLVSVPCMAQSTILPKTTVLPKTTAIGGKNVPVAYVSAASGNTVSGTTTCVLTKTFTSGQLLLAFVFTADYTDNVSAITSTVSDGVNTWTQFSTSPFTDSTNTTKSTYWWTKPASGSTTVTFTNTSSTPYIACYIVAYTSSTGWKSSPVDQQATANIAVTSLGVCATTTTLSSGTTSATAQASELVVGLLGISLTNSSTPAQTYAGSGGYTERLSLSNSGQGGEVVDLTTTTTGAQTATGTLCVASSASNTGGNGVVVTMMPN